MIKRFFLIGIITGNLILLITYLFIKYLPESGPLAIFSKMYHLSRLVGGSIWNEWIVKNFQISAAFMNIYTVGYYIIIYSAIYGIFGLAAGMVGKLYTRFSN